MNASQICNIKIFRSWTVDSAPASVCFPKALLSFPINGTAIVATNGEKVNLFYTYPL